MGLGRPLSLNVWSFSMNLSMPICMLWHFSSNLSIRFLLERTFFILMMAFVLSSTPNPFNSCLFYLFKKWMSWFTTSGYSPKSSFTFCIASVATFTNFVCLNITWIDGQISLTKSMILAQSISLVYPSGFCNVRSFYRTLILSPILRAFYASSFCCIWASLKSVSRLSILSSSFFSSVA